jgi:hypothetical protein
MPPLDQCHEYVVNHETLLPSVAQFPEDHGREGILFVRILLNLL